MRMDFSARARSGLRSSAELGVDAASTTVKRSVDANACRKSQPLHNRRAATARQWQPAKVRGSPQARTACPIRVRSSRRHAQVVRACRRQDGGGSRKRSNGAAVRRSPRFFMAWRRKWHYFYSRRTPYALKAQNGFGIFCNGYSFARQCKQWLDHEMKWQQGI